MKLSHSKYLYLEALLLVTALITFYPAPCKAAPVPVVKPSISTLEEPTQAIEDFPSILAVETQSSTHARYLRFRSANPIHPTELLNLQFGRVLLQEANIFAAAYYFFLSTQAGNLDARYEFAKLVTSNAGLFYPNETRLARRHLQNAADQGHKKACHFYAYLLEFYPLDQFALAGDPACIRLAIEYYESAVIFGETAAIQDLERLACSYSEARDSITILAPVFREAQEALNRITIN